jgi:hypothetical protein
VIFSSNVLEHIAHRDSFQQTRGRSHLVHYPRRSEDPRAERLGALLLRHRRDRQAQTAYTISLSRRSPYEGQAFGAGYDKLFDPGI